MAIKRLAGHVTHGMRESSVEAAFEADVILQEHYAAAAASIMSLRSEDQGWTPINRLDKEDGFTLESLQEISQYAELQSTGNPLLKRGFTLRRDNVFGKGVSFESAPAPKAMSDRIKGILSKPSNEAVLNSKDAFSRLERSAFICGNVFMAYRKSTEQFFPIPFGEISNYASNPDLEQDVWYYQRTYNKPKANSTELENDSTIEWYPVLERWEMSRTNKRAPLASRIDNKPVVDDVVIVDMKVNTVMGRVWGVPDVLPALPYAWAHAEYIRDASKLLKALSTIAWKVVGRTKANVVNASAQMSKAKGAANTATMTEGSDLVAMPKSGQVDMTDGQTIASYVASALEVSTVAILSDPSIAAGGAYAASSLDGPSANAARNRQGLWADFYKRVYRAAGAKDVIVNFPKLQEEPLYRQAQLLEIGYAYGALHQDEFRTAFLEVSDITALRSGLPKPGPFTVAAQYSVEAQKKADAEAKKASDDDAAARAAANVQGQGRDAPAGTGLGSDNTGRDMDSKAGAGV
jgi:hypothetical protein